MPIINIEIKNKSAAALESPLIVCGNSDYEINFTFDAEWDAFAKKTARFSFYREGFMRFIDVIFSGAKVSVPVLSDIAFVDVGVFAGDLHTTTGARIPCRRSILCEGGTPPDPTPEVYAQIMQELNYLKEGAGMGKKTAEGGEIFNDYHLNDAGPNAHAEGTETRAYGENSHTSGRRTIARYENQFVCGQLNDNKEDTLFEVGNGYSNEDEGNVQSNAFEVYKDGHAEVQIQGETENSVVTKKYVDDAVATGGGGVSKEYVDSHLEGISDLVSDNQDDIRNLGERTETLETKTKYLPELAIAIQNNEQNIERLTSEVETIKQGYVTLDYVNEKFTTGETVDRRIDEYDLIVQETYASKEYVNGLIGEIETVLGGI